jgi:hypothetical protein
LLLQNLGKFQHFEQGCRMVYFQTKNANFGIFWGALERKMLDYFKAI